MKGGDEVEECSFGVAVEDPAGITDAVAGGGTERVLGAGKVVMLEVAFGGDGVFGVEMFLNGNGELFVNEIAPRTHNSGHHTMDAASTSQFGQQLRGDGIAAAFRAAGRSR